MPGSRITDLQMTKYKELRGKHTQEAAAAKTGISVSSARRVEASALLPSQRPPRSLADARRPAEGGLGCRSRADAGGGADADGA